MFMSTKVKVIYFVSSTNIGRYIHVKKKKKKAPLRVVKVDNELKKEKKTLREVRINKQTCVGVWIHILF